MPDQITKGKPEGSRRRMDKFHLGEVSFVNRPAQAPAVAQIMKADLQGADVDKLLDDSAWGDPTEKAGDLVHMATGETAGHQHAISFFPATSDGEPSLIVQYAMAEGDERGHDHQIIRGSDGTFSVTANAGHTHDIDSAELTRALTDFLMKNEEGDPAAADPAGEGTEGQNGGEPVGKGGNDMPAETKELDALKAKNASLEAIAALTGVQKSHFDTLEGDDAKSAFLKMDDAGKAQAIADVAKAAEDADPVVYKADNGDEFRKSDDPRLVKMAQERDDERKENIRLQKAAENERFEKRAADELGNLSGSIKVRAAILKAVDGIADEDIRTEATNVLKAKNAQMAGAFTTVGHGGTKDLEKSNSAEAANAELETLAKARATADSIDFYEAYEKVSDENPELLAKAMG